MSDRQQHGAILAMDQFSTSSLGASESNGSGRDILKTSVDRPPPISASAKFDMQVAGLSIRSQGTGGSGDTSVYMAAVAQATADQASRMTNSQRKSSTGDDETDPEDQRVGVKSKPKRTPRPYRAESLSVRTPKTKQPIGLVVALFHNGFVCRHINKENENVEGFAQPYDVESSYFLACIDNGRVPAGLPDMIACAHHRGSVLAEIRDYREMRTSLCPVSSAFLPAASALPQAHDINLDAACRVWQTILKPSKSPLPVHAQVSPLLESQSLQSVFDHFPDITPGELATLAMDAKRQLLQEEDVLVSSSSTESSSPHNESHGLGFLSAESRNGAKTKDYGALTSTPITRSRFQGAQEISPPASLLSPIGRKSARSSFPTNSHEEDSPARHKRHCPTKVNEDNRVDDRTSEAIERNLRSIGTFESPEPSCDEYPDEDMDECELPSCSNNQDFQSEYSDVEASDETGSITPLPATQHFLSKLKGKRRRPENQPLYGKPAWVAVAHIGRYFRAATRLEREHSQFLHANAKRLMQAEKPPTETELLSGSMHYLSRQLDDLTRPSDVIAVARARKIKEAQDEGRQLRRRDWMEDGTIQEEAATALISPDNDPVLKIRRIDTEQNLFRVRLRTSSLNAASPIHEYQLAAGAIHFNYFDDDGNLQPRIT